jgi:hypothetical protein
MQTVIVVGIIALAALFLARRWYKSATRPSQGCGCGCTGCDIKDSSPSQRPQGCRPDRDG